jgi:hypothetical protein
MGKPRQVVDSYTGTIWEEPYTSPIPGIMQGRQAFYKRAEKLSVQYVVALTQPDPPSPALPPAWSLTRCLCERFPDQTLLTFPSPEQARRAADWAIRNDASVQIALHWLTQKDLGPYLDLLERLMTEAEE